MHSQLDAVSRTSVRDPLSARPAIPPSAETMLAGLRLAEVASATQAGLRNAFANASLAKNNLARGMLYEIKSATISKPVFFGEGAESRATFVKEKFNFSHGSVAVFRYDNIGYVFPFGVRPVFFFAVNK